MQTLSMRDPMTARHSAAVARYAREVGPDARPRRARAGPDPHRRACCTTSASSSSLTRSSSPTASSPTTSGRPSSSTPSRARGSCGASRATARWRTSSTATTSATTATATTRCRSSEVPLGSRIIAAADTYDVMTSRDSYRRPVSSEAALTELRRVAGSQLDPIVVETFEKMILERGIAFRHADARRLRDRARTSTSGSRTTPARARRSPRHLFDQAVTRSPKTEYGA